VYDQNFEAALTELGLDARGVAASGGWQVEPTLLRTLLRKLRGICTHPQVRGCQLNFPKFRGLYISLQVGQLQKLGDKLFKPGALKSMTEVLEVRFSTHSIEILLIGA
jgi:E3 ubiquitin-protein ligase SHPRH